MSGNTLEKLGIQELPMTALSRWLLPLPASLVAAFGLAGFAVACRNWGGLAALLAGNLLLLTLRQVKWSILWQAGRMLIGQSVVLVGLYVLRYGSAVGFPQGMLLSCQLMLAFLPGMIVSQAISRSELTAILARLLPAQGAFVLATTLHFFPLLQREMKTLYAAQVLRGCRIMPRNLLNPLNWRDLVRGLLVPAIVHALVLAGDIALAARVREFSPDRQRTVWPGKESS